MKKLIACIFLFTSFGAHAQKIDKTLQNKITKLVEGFNGEVGVYVYDLTRNKIAAVNADTIYPTASMVKIPILIGVMHKINEGQLLFHQQMTYTDSLFYSEGDDMLASFKSGEKIDLAKVLMLMMSTSDNAASLWLQGLAGGGAVINNYMNDLGLNSTRVNSRTEGRRDDWKIYGWGQTTPKELALLMKMIVENKIINKTISERMLRLMGRQYWDEYALSQIPPNVFVADKGGAVDASRGEILYVNGDHPYIFAVCSKNNKDQSWDSNNEAWELTRKLSSMLWKYFNPKSKWEPSPLIK
ncbi:MAG: serine hydrolase [Ginsengibacter sp.]